MIGFKCNLGVDSVADRLDGQSAQTDSINEIPKGCQLTRGALYGHFKSKSQLYSEAIVHAARPRGANWTDSVIH